MFSAAGSPVSSRIAWFFLFVAVFFFPSVFLAQQPAEHASGPAHPSELRVFDPSLVDKSVDPCENFYRYSCNGWFKRNPLPADQTSYGRFTELYELNRLHLKQILEG